MDPILDYETMLKIDSHDLSDFYLRIKQCVPNKKINVAIKMNDNLTLHYIVKRVGRYRINVYDIFLKETVDKRRSVKLDKRFVNHLEKVKSVSALVVSIGIVIDEIYRSPLLVNQQPFGQNPIDVNYENVSKNKYIAVSYDLKTITLYHRDNRVETSDLKHYLNDDKCVSKCSVLNGHVFLRHECVKYKVDLVGVGEGTCLFSIPDWGYSNTIPVTPTKSHYHYDVKELKCNGIIDDFASDVLKCLIDTTASVEKELSHLITSSEGLSTERMYLRVAEVLNKHGLKYRKELSCTMKVEGHERLRSITIHDEHIALHFKDGVNIPSLKVLIFDVLNYDFIELIGDYVLDESHVQLRAVKDKYPNLVIDVSFIDDDTMVVTLMNHGKSITLSSKTFTTVEDYLFNDVLKNIDALFNIYLR